MVCISVQFLCNFCAISDRDPEKKHNRQLKYNRKILLLFVGINMNEQGILLMYIVDFVVSSRINDHVDRNYLNSIFPVMK
jgi:hypothetical protein